VGKEYLSLSIEYQWFLAEKEIEVWLGVEERVAQAKGVQVVRERLVMSTSYDSDPVAEVTRLVALVQSVVDVEALVPDLTLI
jgi:hypothetical protein